MVEQTMNEIADELDNAWPDLVWTTHESATCAHLAADLPVAQLRLWVASTPFGATVIGLEPIERPPGVGVAHVHMGTRCTLLLWLRLVELEDAPRCVARLRRVLVGQAWGSATVGAA